MIRRLTALSAVALLALGACTDAPVPTADVAAEPRPTALPRLKRAASGADLPVAEKARSAKQEPSNVDRGRFDIAFKFVVPISDARRAVFQQAADRWSRTIVKDVPSVGGELPSCFVGLPPVSSDVVDDLVIEVALTPIDGPGGILGQAGPCYIRFADNLPVSGVMFFDSEDLDFLDKLGLFDEVIVHEMGHVLGIGTLWNFERALLQGTGAEPFFAGKHANTHWNAEGGANLLPVENIGGPGTAFAHWREGVLNNELMTGFLNLGENPLSRITAGSLRDLGYGVGIVGEQYALPKGAPGVSAQASAPSAASGTITTQGVHIGVGETLLRPIGMVRE